MMNEIDIKKELKEINENINNADNIIENLENEEHQIKIKKHIIKVLNVAFNLEQIINTNYFVKTDIEVIEISHYYDYDLFGECFEATYKNKNNESIDIYDNNGQHIEEVSKVNTLLKKLDGTENDFIGKFDSKEILNININVDKDIKEKIYNILLSKDLQKIVSYNMMENDLSNKTNKDNKIKVKI